MMGSRIANGAVCGTKHSNAMENRVEAKSTCSGAHNAMRDLRRQRTCAGRRHTSVCQSTDKPDGYGPGNFAAGNTRPWTQQQPWASPHRSPSNQAREKKPRIVTERWPGILMELGGSGRATRPGQQGSPLLPRPLYGLPHLQIFLSIIIASACQANPPLLASWGGRRARACNDMLADARKHILQLHGLTGSGGLEGG